MMEQEGKSMETIQRYDMISVSRCGMGWQELQKEPEGDWMLYEDHIAALAAKDAAIAAYKGAVRADVAEFTRDSATLEAQAEQIRVLREALKSAAPVMTSLDVYGRYLPVRYLIADALASTAPVAEAGQDFQDALTHIDMLTKLVGDLAQEINYVRDLGGQEFLSSSYPGSLKRADEFLNSIAREDRGGSK